MHEALQRHECSFLLLKGFCYGKVFILRGVPTPIAAIILYEARWGGHSNSAARHIATQSLPRDMCTKERMGVCESCSLRV